MASWKTYRVPVRITQELTYEVKARSIQEAVDKVEGDMSLEPVADDTLYVEVERHRIALDNAGSS